MVRVIIQYAVLFTLMISFILADETMHEDILIVSNFPETFSKPGLMLSYKTASKATRLLYHHRNIAKNRLSLNLVAHNQENEPVDLYIQAGLGGSTEDIVFAGHKATRDFFSQIENDGKKIRIPGNSIKTLSMHAVKPQQTSSGIIRVVNKDEKNIKLQLSSVDPELPHLSSFPDINQGLMQFKFGVFQQAYRRVEKTFSCKNPLLQIPVGGPPFIKDQFSDYILKGNYGVLYDIQLTLKNPTNQTKTVDFWLSPTKDNAIDRGVVAIDGRLVEVGVVLSKAGTLTMEKFHEIILNPKEIKHVNLLTMPQAGCFYPIDLILRSRDILL